MLPQQLTHRTLITYNPNIGHLFVPNTFIRVPVEDKPYFVKTNKQGFRSNFDYICNKICDKRIMFLGDSHTAGDGVSNEDRFSDIISRYFNNLETYNFGLSGSGIDQQVLIYETIAKKYDHDIVCFSPHLIDIERLGCTRNFIDRNTGEFYKIPKPFFNIDDDKLILHNVPVPLKREKIKNTDKSNLFEGERARQFFYKYVPSIIKERVLRRNYYKIYGEYEEASTERWKLMKLLIYRLIEKAEERPIILCPLPDPRFCNIVNYQLRFIEIQEKFDNVFFIDMAKQFKKYKRKERWGLQSDKTFHFNKFGHRVIANAITESVRENKLVPKNSYIKCKGLGQKNVESYKFKNDIYILGISAFYHDSACTLIKNSEIIASAQEERFTRIKHDSSFPYGAINYCLEEGKMQVQDLDAIVFYDCPMRSLERIISSQMAVAPGGKEIWINMIPRWIQTKLRIPEIVRDKLDYDGKLFFVNHHLSHAASAFFASPFEEAAILTIDGVGEWATACIAHGRGNKIDLIKKIEYPDSLGLLYSAFTYYTGFKVNNGEYKLMGLAPYGEGKYVDIIKKHLIDIKEDGSIKLNMKFFGYLNKMSMTNKYFNELFGGPPRKPGSKITQREMDLAKSIQLVTEEIVLKMANHAHELTGCDYLCLAGGVALNCVANGRLLREGKFKDIWIQPAAGDAGGSLGAALFLYYSHYDKKRLLNKNKSPIQRGSYWGPDYSDDEVVSVLNSYNYEYKKVERSERSKLIASYLAKGKIIGHFSDRMEFGPRALGARSILGDPRDKTTQSKLNLKIKYRESFRPFAPTVLVEDIREYFDIDCPSPYMLLVAPVKKERCLPITDESDIMKRVNQKRSDVPAITHVDYSARIQSIDKKDHQLYYDIIKEFKNLTGYGIIVNTSFNVRGEPIVCTPYDALNCFMNTEMDVLAIENYILLKEDQKEALYTKRGKALEKSRPMNVTKSDEIKKLEKKAEKLFSKYITSITNKTEKIPIDLNFKQRSGVSFWKPWNEKELYWEYNNDLKIHADKEVEYILNFWNKYSNKDKEILKPLIKELVTLKNKFKSEDIMANEGVSGSIYVMF